MDEAPKTATSSKVVYTNPWITIREDQTVTSDGQEGLYAYLESRDSVMIALFDEQDRVCLVKSFRYPSKTWGWEFPGGGGDGENPLEAARRELEEETGMLADSWDVLGSTLVCNGFMTERMTTCAAHNVHSDGQKEKSDEIIADLKFVSLSEADQMVTNGEINDGQTITALYFAHQWHERNRDRER